VTQLDFQEFTLIELQVPPRRPKSAKGFPFELGKKMVQELGSSAKGFRDPMTHTSTPKFVEEVVAEVMKVDKVTKLFQTMAIVNLNMGNLTLGVNTLKIRLIMGEKEKVVL
jgi:hypothetical protein